MNDTGFNQWNDGDTSFRGVDMRSAPNAVANGLTSLARNARFRFGKAETRGGVTKFATLTPSQTLTWPITWRPATLDFVWTTSLTVSVQGAEVFDDANGQRWVISVANGLVWKSRPGEAATAVPVENDIPIVGNVFMVQCFDSMLMFREDNQTPLVMTDVDYGFHAIQQTPSGTGTIVIPNATSGEFIQNRLVVPHDVDQLAVSDIGDYTRYLPTFNELRANEGSGDSIMRVFKFGETAALVFKERSIIQILNFTGDLSSIAASELTREFGLVAKKAVIGVGRDVWFLSQRGIDSIGLTTQNKIQPGNEPVSGPMQPLIDRINWPYAGGSVAAYFDNRAYFAVPLDDSTVNNAIIVYDFVTQSWNGYDDGDAMADVRAFFQFQFGGRERLFFFDNNGFCNLYEYGETDDVWDGSVVAREGIGFQVRTRGYCGGSNDWKHFKQATLRASTWNPRFSVSAVFNGNSRTSSLVSNRTRSRLTATRFGVSPWDSSNASADHAAEQRQDYSVPFPLTGVYPNGSAGTGVGIALGITAPSSTRVAMRGEGEYAQMDVTCDTGRIQMEGAELSATPGKRAMGTET